MWKYEKKKMAREQEERRIGDLWRKEKKWERAWLKQAQRSKCVELAIYFVNPIFPGTGQQSEGREEKGGSK